MRGLHREPCLCGDPECGRCFPFPSRRRDYGELADEGYERQRQEAADGDEPPIKETADGSNPS